MTGEGREVIMAVGRRGREGEKEGKSEWKREETRGEGTLHYYYYYYLERFC